MWKTRNIRRRNKGKKTKRQDGGLLSFMGPDMQTIINFAIKNDMDVTAQFEKKTGMVSKTIITFKVKFIKGGQLKFIQDEESKLDEINANLKPDTPYKYVIKGSNLEVTLNLKNETKIMIAISKTSIEDIKNKLKIEKETDLQKIKEIKQKTDDKKVQQKEEEVQKKKEEKYTFKSFQINTYFKRHKVGTQPYSNSELNYLYYCIETYLPVDALTQDAVHKFVEEFEKSLTESPKKEMNKEDAMIRLKAGIDQFKFMNKSKTKLQEIVKILSVDVDQLDNYLTPNQSLNKKCSAITIGDDIFAKDNLIKYNSEICFIVESLKPYAEDELVLLDINNPDDRNKMSVADFVENGARLEETWKLSEFNPHYEYFAYVSKGEDVNSLVGFMCYDKQSNPNILKVSNIIWAKNDIGENQELRKKLYDILDNELTGKSLQSKLLIPEQLDDKVNATVYTKGETKDGFTMWEAIMPPAPTEMEIKIKAETNPKAVTFLEFLQKLLKSAAKPATDIKPAVSTDDVKLDIQTGGADNALLDEIITKYPSLKGLKSMIDNLPEDIQQKYDSDITNTLEKVKESNMEEIDAEILADLNAQIVEKEEKAIEEEKEKAAEEPPTEPPTTESKEGETPTDTVEPTVETPTDTVEPTVVTPTTDTTTTETTVETEPTVEPTTTDTVEPTTTTTDTTVVTPATIETTTTVVEPATTDTTTTTTTDVTPTAGVTPPTDEPTTTVVTPTSGTEPSNTDVTTTTTTTVTPSSSDEVTLKREDLKESPLLVQPATGESGKYIFVPKDLVEKVIDYLLNNGCEVTTVNLK